LRRLPLVTAAAALLGALKACLTGFSAFLTKSLG